VILTRDHVGSARSLPESVKVDEEDSELELINRLIDVVREFDPDVLCGYEIQSLSWGFIIERARMHFGTVPWPSLMFTEFNLCDDLSRMKSMSYGRFDRENDRWGFNQASAIRITGRHMINIWRAMRGELNLNQYTLENVVFHLLRKRSLSSFLVDLHRIPHYAYSDLTRWYQHGDMRKRVRVLKYYISRCRLDVDVLEAQELIPRVWYVIPADSHLIRSEQARVLGVDFYSIFSRGSQFKVESLMLRISKAECFLLVSPSRKQVIATNHDP